MSRLFHGSDRASPSRDGAIPSTVSFSRGAGGLGGSPLSGEGFLDAGGAFRVGSGQAVEQAIRAGFQELGKLRKCHHGKRIAASLDVAEGLPMYADQFSDTFLSQPELRASLSNIPSDKSKYFAL